MRQVRKILRDRRSLDQGLSLAIAKGSLGKHYQLGWEEQKKHGGSLIDEKSMIDLPDRVPEGVKLPAITILPAA